MQSVPNTTKVVSLTSHHGEVYSIQHYVIKFDSDLRQVWFSPDLKCAISGISAVKRSKENIAFMLQGLFIVL